MGVVPATDVTEAVVLDALTMVAEVAEEGDPVAVLLLGTVGDIDIDDGSLDVAVGLLVVPAIVLLLVVEGADVIMGVTGVLTSVTVGVIGVAGAPVVVCICVELAVGENGVGVAVVASDVLTKDEVVVGAVSPVSVVVAERLPWSVAFGVGVVVTETPLVDVASTSAVVLESFMLVVGTLGDTVLLAVVIVVISVVPFVGVAPEVTPLPLVVAT